MNYNSMDIEKISFRKKAFGGYGKERVNEAMRKVAEDYRSAEKEEAELKDKIAVLTETVQHYKTIEESMQHCLIIAQHTSDEMIKSANGKADEIIAQADATSQKMISDAHEQANKLKFTYDDMKAKINTLKLKSEALMKSSLEIIGQLAEEKTANP